MCKESNKACVEGDVRKEKSRAEYRKVEERRGEERRKERRGEEVLTAKKDVA